MHLNVSACLWLIFIVCVLKMQVAARKILFRPWFFLQLLIMKTMKTMKTITISFLVRG